MAADSPDGPLQNVLEQETPDEKWGARRGGKGGVGEDHAQLDSILSILLTSVRSSPPIRPSTSATPSGGDSPGRRLWLMDSRIRMPWRDSVPSAFSRACGACVISTAILFES
ncbi:uncharacterized protein J3R85_008891 [Psidium guajava]|nr:uncharacterized protein J3R85_008891 [Psidium guajava]